MAVALIVYLPGARPLKTKLPSPLVVTVFSAPLALTATTVAPTMTPPNSSETWPFRVPELWCPSATPAQKTRINNKRPIQNDSLAFVDKWAVFCLLELRRGGLDFGYMRPQRERGHPCPPAGEARSDLAQELLWKWFALRAQRTGCPLRCPTLLPAPANLRVPVAQPFIPLLAQQLPIQWDAREGRIHPIG